MNTPAGRMQFTPFIGSAVGGRLREGEPRVGEGARNHGGYTGEGRDSGSQLFWLPVSISSVPSAKASGRRLDLTNLKHLSDAF